MGPVLLHTLAPIGDALGVRCTGCGHETRYHHAVHFGAWNCDICGGRCSSVVKTAVMHATHPYVDILGGVNYTNCSHSSKRHYSVGFGKWKCKDCGSTCVS